MHAGPLGCERGGTSILTHHGLPGAFAGRSLSHERSARQRRPRHRRLSSPVAHAHACGASLDPLRGASAQHWLGGQSTWSASSLQQRGAEAGSRPSRRAWRCRAGCTPSGAGVGGGGSNGSAPVESTTDTGGQQAADQNGVTAERPPPKVLLDGLVPRASGSVTENHCCASVR